MDWLQQVKPGDVVVRSVAGALEMRLYVSDVDQDFIHCGAYKFSRATGGEIDEDLGWTATQTGSLLIRKESP